MNDSFDTIIESYKYAPHTSLEAICLMTADAITHANRMNAFQIPFLMQSQDIQHVPTFEWTDGILPSLAQCTHNNHTAPIMLAVDLMGAQNILTLFLGSKQNELTRELSDFERQIVANFLKTVLNEISLHLTEWESSAPNVSWEAWLSDPQKIEHVVILPFEISIQNDQTGIISLIIPHSSLELWWPKLNQRFYGYEWGRDSYWRKHWETILQNPETQHLFNICYPSFQCRIGDIAAWSIGSHIPIESSKIAQGLCYDTAFIEGSIGHKHGHLALRVDHWIQTGDTP